MKEIETIERYNQPNHRVHEILDVVLAYANFEYDKRAKITGESDLMDALATGINMLGDELKASTISLQEKDVLLKELHHRVKNNLQIMSSIMDLQMGFTKNPVISEKLAKCQVRIQAMALVREKLYASSDLSKVGLNEYFDALCSYLETTYNDGQIKFSFRPLNEGIFLCIDRLIPLGLILSEILSNAFKHAFVDVQNENSTIIVELKADEHNFILLVRDNGRGFASKKQYEQPETLGMILINALVQQIEAKMETNNNGGVNYVITLERDQDKR